MFWHDDKLNKAKLAAIEFMETFHPGRDWWIVGGALRDTVLSRDFKDIDIFISGFTTDLLPDDAIDLGDRNAYLLRAYTVKDYPYKSEKFEINLIFMRGDQWSLESMTNRCDFGICQIGWCPKEDRTYKSRKFERDVNNTTLTLTRNTSQERLKRMKSKFVAYDFINPDRLTIDTDRRWVYSPEEGALVVKYDQYVPVTLK